LKRIAAIFFFLSIFLNQVGYYIFCSYQQYQVKKEVERQLLANSLHESEMDIFVLEEYKDKIKWEEDGKEFYLDGEMYDVVRTREHGGKTVLYCLKDTKEQELLNHLVKLVKDTRKNSRSGKIIKAPVNTYEAPITDINLGLTLPHSRHYVCFTTPLHSSVKEILAPPPKG
jgi:hypothetical protein